MLALKVVIEVKLIEQNMLDIKISRALLFHQKVFPLIQTKFLNKKQNLSEVEIFLLGRLARKIEN